MRLLAVLTASVLVASCVQELETPSLQPSKAEPELGEARASCGAAACTHDVAYWREHPEAWPADEVFFERVIFWHSDLSCTASECGYVDDAGWAMIAEFVSAILNLQQLLGVPTSVDGLMREADTYVANCFFDEGPCVPEDAPRLMAELAAFNEGRTSIMGEACGAGLACLPGTIICGEGGLECSGVMPATEEVCGNDVDDDCNGLTDEDCGCLHSVAYWQAHASELPDEGFTFGGLSFYPGTLFCTAEACGLVDDDGWQLNAELMAAVLNRPASPSSIDSAMMDAVTYMNNCAYQAGPCDPSNVVALRDRLAAFNQGTTTETCGTTGACFGTLSCTNGTLACDAPAPVSEVLDNGVDDDCDGKVDEACEPGQGEPELAGNGADDDCDGKVDEVCDPDQIVPEILENGVDDDCDGKVDELCGPESGIPEIRDNGKDDDCDGEIDEGGVFRTVYLNGLGATFEHAETDSSVANLSFLAQRRSVIPPYAGSAEAWHEIVSCVKQHFAPFDVTITELDPGPQPHVEAVVGGRSGLLGLQQGISGVAKQTCSPTGDAIVFTFSDYIVNVRDICDTVAHEVGHAYGLDHEALAPDLMSYWTPRNKGFQDAPSACGEFTGRPCICGNSSQNSFAHLAARLGRSASSPTPAPVVPKALRLRPAPEPAPEPVPTSEYVGVCSTFAP